MNKSLINAALLASLLLTACGSDQGIALVPTQTMTGTFIAAPPIKETVPILTQTSTLTPAAEISHPTTTASPKVLPTNTPAPPATATMPGKAVLNPKDSSSASIGKSPDGNWIWAVEDLETDKMLPYRLYTTRIVQVDGKKEWLIRYSEEDFPGSSMPFEAWYEPFFWLPEEPYVYLVGQACCADGPISFFTGWNLSRLDLTTGELTQQIPEWRIHVFAFAENGKYLLDITKGRFLRIIRLKDGNIVEIQLPEEFDQNGSAAFSPDNKLLALQSRLLTDPDQYPSNQFSLLLVDIEAQNYRVLVDDLLNAMGETDLIFTETSWHNENTLILTERLYDSQSQERKWLVDIRSGEVQPEYLQ